jgi:hypothetical protein
MDVKDKKVDSLNIHTANTGYTIREVQHQGRKHIVVPVIMMVEGVHNGSAGPILHTIQGLGMFLESWNSIPVVIDHPVMDGQNISANSPEIIDSRTVGRVYNTHVNNTRLMAEAWIDEEKIRQLSAVALNAIVNQEPLDVSVGIYTEEETIQGNWNGETYEGIARNYHPDHLALLPGGTGACSWNDGCGIRSNNKKEGGSNVMSDEELKTQKSSHIQSLIDSNVDQGYRTLVQSAQQKIDAMDSDSVVHFLQEVYDEYVVYEARMRVGGMKLFKQSYQYSEETGFELMGTPTEVLKKVEYVPIQTHMKRTKFNINNKKEEVKTMANEKCTPCIEKKVNALIANKLTKYTDSDKEWLQTLEEVQLDQMVPIVEEKKPEVIVETEKKPDEKKPEVVSTLSDEDKADLAWAKAQRKQTRNNLIEGIQANTEKDTWPETELQAMSEDTLRRLYKSVKKEEVEESGSNFMLNNTPKIQSNVSDEILLPAGVEIETKN